MSKIFGKSLPISTSNYAINGNFDHWQRGVTFNGITNNTYAADRFWQATTQTATINVTRQSINALGLSSQYGLRIERTSGSTLGQWGIGQSIEAQDFNRLKGKTVTLSCLLRKGANYNGNVLLKVASRTLETRSAFAVTNDVDVASVVVLNSALNTSSFVAARISLSIPAGTSATAIELQIYDNSTQLGASGAYFEVAQVQLVDAAIQPPAYIYAGGSIADEFSRCLRYYETSSPVASEFYILPIGSATQANKQTIRYIVPKRAAVSPSVTQLSGVANQSIGAFDVAGFTTVWSGGQYDVQNYSWKTDAEL